MRCWCLGRGEDWGDPCCACIWLMDRGGGRICGCAICCACCRGGPELLRDGGPGGGGWPDEWPGEWALGGPDRPDW